jgi:hypothetical protein
MSVMNWRGGGQIVMGCEIRTCRLPVIWPRWLALPVLALLMTACSSAPFRHEPLDQFDIVDRAISQESGELRVHAAVPSPEEAESLLGIPVYDRGIQPVWLSIHNGGDREARLVLSSIDPEYFAPMEVAYMFRKKLSTQGWRDLERFLYENALPRQILPGQTVSGYVFTHARVGTKAFNIDVFYAGAEREYEGFTFFVEVPGFVPDHAEIDFSTLYAADAVRETDAEGLRRLLQQEVPCCTTNREGDGAGRPANLVFVAPTLDLLQALLRAGWWETSYRRDETYLAKTDYLFGRPPDSIFRTGRDGSTERDELALWLSPYRVDGHAVWVGQTKHAIGRRYEIGERFLGVRLDPDLADGRNFVMQNLWYAQSLKHWAWLRSVEVVPPATPKIDFNGNPWFMDDPFRVVIWISDQPLAMQDAKPILWDDVNVAGGGLP